MRDKVPNNDCCFSSDQEMWNECKISHVLKFVYVILYEVETKLNKIICHPHIRVITRNTAKQTKHSPKNSSYLGEWVSLIFQGSASDTVQLKPTRPEPTQRKVSKFPKNFSQILDKSYLPKVKLYSAEVTT